MINSFFCDFKNFGLDVKFGLWRDCGINIQEIFENHFLKRSPRIGIGFVSPFIALKIPYDQSTETKPTWKQKSISCQNY
jgi:hypothetical protein